MNTSDGMRLGAMVSGVVGSSYGGISEKCLERYSFLHMSIQDNPVKCYRCFEELIAEGEHIIGEVPKLDEEDTEKDKDPKSP